MTTSTYSLGASAEATSTVEGTRTVRPVWRTGLGSGLLAAITNLAIVVAARRLGVSFEDPSGSAIPLLGFAQLTLIGAAGGIALAALLGRRARTPRRTFVMTAAVFTTVSFVTPFLVEFDVASRAVLELTHLVAAVVITTGLASRLER